MEHPKISFAIEGKGCNIFTILYNIDDICKVIKRDPRELLGEISRNIGSGYKRGKMGSYHKFCGEFYGETIDEIIDNYIEKNVKCSNCRLYETIINGSNKICQSCNMIWIDYKLFEDN